MKTDREIKTAAEWAAQLFRERTILVAENRAQVLDIVPETRVSWHEINRAHGLSGPDDRVAFQPYFNRAVKRLGLWQVLKRKELASVWWAREQEKSRHESQTG